MDISVMSLLLEWKTESRDNEPGDERAVPQRRRGACQHFLSGVAELGGVSRTAPGYAPYQSISRNRPYCDFRAAIGERMFLDLSRYGRSERDGPTGVVLQPAVDDASVIQDAAARLLVILDADEIRLWSLKPEAPSRA